MQEVLDWTIAESIFLSGDGESSTKQKLLTSLNWRERAQCIANVAMTARHCSNPPTFIRNLYKAMSDALRSDRFCLYLMDTYGNHMVECASLMDMNAVSVGGMSRIAKDMGRTEIIMGGAPEVVDCLHPRIDDCVTDELFDLGCRMLLVTPLIAGSESVGIYCAMYEDMLPVTSQDMDYALMLGQVVGPLANNINWRPRWDGVPDSASSAMSALPIPAETIHVNPNSVSVHISMKAREELFEKDRLLSKRERELMELIADGFSNQEIANQLFLSNSTVKKYVASLMRKLDVDNRVQIATHAIEMRLLDDRVFR